MKFETVEHLTIEQVRAKFAGIDDAIKRELAGRGLVQEPEKPDLPDGLTGIITNTSEVPRVRVQWTSLSDPQLGELYNYYIAWAGYIGVVLAEYKNSYGIAKASMPKIKAALLRFYKESDSTLTSTAIKEEWIPLHPYMVEADANLEHFRGLVNHTEAMGEALRRAVRGLSREMTRRGMEWEEASAQGGKSRGSGKPNWAT